MDWRPPEPECVVNGDGLEHVFFFRSGPHFCTRILDVRVRTPDNIISLADTSELYRHPRDLPREPIHHQVQLVVPPRPTAHGASFGNAWTTSRSRTRSTSRPSHSGSASMRAGGGTPPSVAWAATPKAWRQELGEFFMEKIMILGTAILRRSGETLVITCRIPRRNDLF